MLFRVLAKLFLFALIGAPASALDSQITWEPFGRDQGLSGSSVTAIVQDQTGYLWFSTQTGLNRWDGYTMRVWQKVPFSSNSLSHNLIQTMTLDGNILWLGTYDGLDRFDPATETFQTFSHRDGEPQSLSHNVVTRVYRDHLGRLWVGTLDGLNRLDERSGTFKVYPFVEGRPGGLSGKTIRSLVEDAQGRLWVGSSGGLDLYDADHDTLVHASQLFPGKAPLAGAVMGALRLPRDNYLWLAVWGQGLVRFDPATGDTQVYPLSDPRLFSLNEGEANELHIGTWGGGLIVFRLDTHESFAFRHDPGRPDSLAHNVVYGTFRDRSGLWWVATNGGGVSRYNPQRRQFRVLPMGGKVQTLAQTRPGTLWAGVYNQGLAEIDLAKGTTVWHREPPGKDSLSFDIINTINGTGNRLWVGSNGGIRVFDQGRNGLRPVPVPAEGRKLPEEVITSILVDADGNRWTGTYRSGIVRRPAAYEPGGPETRFLADQNNPHALPNNSIYFIAQDRERRIWVGTNGGLARFRPETGDFQVWSYQANNPRSLPSNSVRGLLEDSQGRFWVTTAGGGLSRLDPVTGVLESYGVADGLSSLSVYSVLEDDTGLLWISSANGLFSFRPETKVFRYYGVADGLSAIEFSYGAVKTQEGDLAFGGLDGVVLLDTKLLVDDHTPPSVALTQIQVLGQPRPVTDHLKVGWQENDVTFSFSALDFRNPGKNLYAYRLEGFDQEWVQAGTRHDATYTNLWPGTYHFRFKGANPSEVWAQSPQVVTLEVEAPPWASWYAILGYAVLFLILLYLADRARITHSLSQKVAELEALQVQLKEANRRLDELSRLDALTGIPNRRALDTWLADEWARSLRQQESMAILMLDIDDFKRYNDFYGHLAGDTCLRTVARTLVDNLHRTTDFCARYGGEEFIVVLHDTDLEGGRFVAERLLEAVDAVGIPHRAASATEFITISVGVSAVVPTTENSLIEVLQTADKALYRAKAAGRHRVEVER